MSRRDFKLNGQDSIMYQDQMSKVQAVQNLAVANVYGVQVGIEIKLPNDFGFSTDFNFQKGEEELDNGEKTPSRHAPPLFGLSRLYYKTQKLDMELNVFFQGKKDFGDMPEEEKSKTETYALDENGNVYSPAWYTLNFKTLYKLSDSIHVSGGIENLTDQRYRPYSSGISGSGRNFILAVSTKF